MSFDIFVYVHYMLMLRYEFRIEIKPIKVIDPQGVIIPYQTDTREKELPFLSQPERRVIA